MRSTKPTRQSAPEPLTDAELAQHIRAAYSTLNSTLQDAARIDPASYAFLGGARYVLTLLGDSQSPTRGAGILEDRRQRLTFALSICFGATHCDVQLRREFFEDVTASEVRVKAMSRPSLLRNFLEFKKSLGASTGRATISIGAQMESHPPQMQYATR